MSDSTQGLRWGCLRQRRRISELQKGRRRLASSCTIADCTLWLGVRPPARRDTWLVPPQLRQLSQHHHLHVMSWYSGRVEAGHSDPVWVSSECTVVYGDLLILSDASARPGASQCLVQCQMRMRMKQKRHLWLMNLSVWKKVEPVFHHIDNM